MAGQKDSLSVTSARIALGLLQQVLNRSDEVGQVLQLAL
jgi:hypothetical protein